MNMFRHEPKYLVKELKLLKDLLPEEFEDDNDLIDKLCGKLKGLTKPLSILNIDKSANRITRQKVYERD